MRKIGGIIGCCLIAVSLLACTACSGLDRLSENLREGAEQLGDDVVIGKSNALITPYQSFEGSRTSDNDAFLATYDASVTGFNGQDILVADTDLKENECREIVIRYQFDSLDGDCQLIYISPDLEEQHIQERAKELAKKAEIIWPYPSIAEVELAPYQLAEKAVQKYSLETYDVNAFTRMLFEALDKRIMNLSPAVKKEYKKLYVAYKLDTNFVDIVFQKQRLRISINMKFSEIHDPNGICKDITGLGRWGNGDVELFMEHQDELDQIMEIVQQSFDAQAE